MNTSAFSHRSSRASRRGFTLMEMIIVLTIIALLVALAMNTLTGVGDTAKEEAAAANVSAFKTALYSYELESGSLPTNDQGLKALWAKPTIEPIPTRWRAMFSEEQTNDPWNHPYQYRNPGKHNPDSFDVYSYGPDGVPDTADDIGNWKSTDSATSSTSNP
jgi:general secretion pathway protein G